MKTASKLCKGIIGLRRHITTQKSTFLYSKLLKIESSKQKRDIIRGRWSNVRIEQPKGCCTTKGGYSSCNQSHLKQ